jgi:predicted nucleic acid-binding protein
MIVVDNALICYLLLPGTHTGEAEQVRARDRDWVAPPLWASEFRNVLRNYLISRQITLDQAVAIMAAAEDMMQGKEKPVASPSVLALAAASGCTAYDCEYVALAKELQLLLITTDREVLRAFPGLAIPPTTYLRT